ncbi:hypothetical protein BJ165DRAFT_1340260 [Panaeolus papilionaceus]|nr:hypothetical protein BJ165DRAFT_1340260 [Panaeolus papilionaceus]
MTQSTARLVNNLQWKQASVIFQLCTGHIQLAKHLFRINKVESPMCKKCKRKLETPYHYLMECPGYETAQRKHFRYMGQNENTMTRLLSEHKQLLKLFKYLNDTRRWGSIFGKFETRIGLET